MGQYFIYFLVCAVVFLIVFLYLNTQEPFQEVPEDLAFVQCDGKYALCYYAKCKMNADGTADCGCHEFDGISLVDVNNIVPKSLRAETQKACPNGLASCPKANIAPICNKINSRLTSTFNTGAPMFEFEGSQECTNGQYANCMTADCERKTAFDGSPITCRCRVESANNYTIAKNPGIGCKNLPKGMVWSGVPKEP